MKNKRKTKSCGCDMNEDVANAILQHIPELAKNIHEGMFRGIGQRAKLAAGQIGQFAKSQYQQARQNVSLEKERSISDLESQMIHAPIARQLGVKTSAVRDILNDPSHPSYRVVKSAVDSNRQTNVAYRRTRLGRQKNIARANDANRVLTSNIATPQQQATMRNQAASYASSFGRPFDAANFNRLNPVNPNLYGARLGAARSRLKDTRRQQIDSSIQQGVVSTAPGLRGKVSRVLARNPRLSRAFKAIDTFI
jgi:hypothetical protein